MTKRKPDRPLSPLSLAGTPKKRGSKRLIDKDLKHFQLLYLLKQEVDGKYTIDCDYMSQCYITSDHRRYFKLIFEHWWIGYSS